MSTILLRPSSKLHSLLRVVSLVAITTLASTCRGQFDTVFNVPPDPALTAIGSNTQLNLFDGGTLPDSFQAGMPDGSSTNVEVNIFGGTVGRRFRAVGGSRVEILGGVFGDQFRAASDSQVTISGGTFDNFSAGGATLHFDGGNVLGTLGVAHSVLDISGGSVEHLDAFAGGQVNITGGFVGHSSQANAGSRVNIAGGTVDGPFHANGGSDVNITGGTVGSLRAHEESSVNISGGAIGPWSTYAGEVTISGGEFRLNGVPMDGLTTAGDTMVLDLPEESLLSGILADGTPFAISSQIFLSPLAPFPIDYVSNALTLQSTSLPPIGPAVITASENPIPQGIRDGQTLVVDAGSVIGDYFIAGPGSRIVVQEGGTIGHQLKAVGATIEVAGGTVGTTRLLDYSLWAFTGTRLLVSGGDVQNTDVRLLAGSQATLSDGVLGWVEAGAGSILRVDGGEVNSFGAKGKVAVSGGRVEFSGIGEHGQMIITGGEVEFITAHGQVIITGGEMESIRADETSQITIAGGGLRRVLQTEGQLNVYGYSGFGSFGETFGARALAGSQVNLMGTEFSVAGVPLSGLSLGEAFMVDDRGVEFTGRLADGFDFYLYSGDVSPDATLTFTLVSLLEGDYNSDGTVEQADLDLVLRNWGDELFNPVAAGWFNDLPDGRIDQSELDAVLLNWGSSVDALAAAGVPEPATWVLLAMGLFPIGVFGRLQSRKRRHVLAW